MNLPQPRWEWRAGIQTHSRQPRANLLCIPHWPQDPLGDLTEHHSPTLERKLESPPRPPCLPMLPAQGRKRASNGSSEQAVCKIPARPAGAHPRSQPVGRVEYRTCVTCLAQSRAQGVSAINKRQTRALLSPVPVPWQPRAHIPPSGSAQLFPRTSPVWVL